MTDLRKAAERVLKTWDKWKGGPFEYEMEALRQALAMQNFSEVNQELEQALAQPKQEPVAHLWECIGRWAAMIAQDGKDAELAPPDWLVDAIGAATAPPKWVGLTDEEIEKQLIKYEASYGWFQFAKAIEAKLKEKNT